MRRDLGIDVDMVRGHYGEYKVLVDDKTVVDGGPLVILGLMPKAKDIIAVVRERLAH